MKNDDISINDTVLFDDEKYVVVALHRGRIDGTLDMHPKVYAQIVTRSKYDENVSRLDVIRSNGFDAPWNSVPFRIVKVSEILIEEATCHVIVEEQARDNRGRA